MIKFYSFRLSILKVENLFNVNTPKEKYFADVLDKITSVDRKTTFNFKNSKFILYYQEELLPGVFCFELAKEETQSIPTEGETKVEETIINSTPYVYVVIDNNKDKQIVLIQDKTSVFSDVNTTRGKIEHFFNDKMRDHSISIVLLPISDNREFWHEVDNATVITELDIKLNGPNMFGGRFEAADFVGEIYKDFNITEVDIKLKNKGGKLKILRENVQSFIKLVASGGGSYVLKMKKNGKLDSLKSDDLTERKTFKENKAQDIDKDELKKKLDDLDKLNE